MMTNAFSLCKRKRQAPIPGMAGSIFQFQRGPQPFPDYGQEGYLDRMLALGFFTRRAPDTIPPARVAALLAQAQAHARAFYVPHLHSQNHEDQPTCWTEAF